MNLNNTKLHQLFKEKGIHFLFHANTVSTSKTFIEQGGLMSRGAIEENGLIQTDQSSDAIDKLFGVWHDIFLDTVDLHGYFPRQNLYGPVAFKISTDFILAHDYNIWVTKDNPINWNQDQPDSEKYFETVQELRENWDKYQRQRKMITIRHQNIPILFDFVELVIIDDPRVTNGKTVYFNECVRLLKESLMVNPPLMNRFQKRQCKDCFCTSNYMNQVSQKDLNRLFL